MTGDAQARRLVTRMSHEQRAVLLRALQAAAVARPPRARIAPGRSAVRPRTVPADPHAGPGRIADQPALAPLLPLFASGTWREVWRPGEEVHLYAVGCTGLGRLAARTDLALAKLGTCAVGGLDRRCRELRGQAYGGVARRASAYRAEAGWDDWAVFRKLQLAPTPPACPVRASSHSLILTAPRGWTPGQVEATVNAALAPFRLQRFADSDAGHAACRERGIDPGSLTRYSRRLRRVEAATELTCVRAQADTPRLAGLVALAIARAVRAGAPEPSAADWRVLDEQGPRPAASSTGGSQPRSGARQLSRSS